MGTGVSLGLDDWLAELLFPMGWPAYRVLHLTPELTLFSIANSPLHSSTVTHLSQFLGGVKASVIRSNFCRGGLIVVLVVLFNMRFLSNSD